MPDIFLSYSREDQTTARRFAEGLQREGFSVWWDQALHPGEAFDQVTEQALEAAQAVIVLWSKTSVTSRWVRAEATQANANNRLVPAMIEPCKRPIMFELTHTADLSEWKGNADDPAWQSFVASLRRFAGGVPAQEVAHPHVPRAASKSKRFGSRAIAIGAVALALLGIASYGIRDLVGGPRPSRSSAATSATTPVQKIALAVLPFENISPDPGQDYIASGLTEAVATELNKIAALRLSGTESSSRFKGLKDDPRSIATKLGVEHLVAGNVQVVANRVLVNIKLLNGADGEQRSSDRYEGDLDDLTSLSDLYREIAVDVARAVGAVLDVGDLPRSQGGTLNPAASRKYWQFVELPRHSARASEGLKLLREALREDESFHAARLALFVMLNAAAFGPDAPALLREKDDHGQLLDRAPEEWQLSSGYRAVRLWEQQEWEKSLEAASRITALGHLSARDTWMSVILLSMGRYTDALSALGLASVTDPLHEPVSQWKSGALLALGRDKEALAERKRLQDAFGGGGTAVEDNQWTRILVVPGDPAARRTMKERMPSKDGRITLPGPLEGQPLTLLDDPVAIRALLGQLLLDSSRWDEGTMALVAAFGVFYGSPDLALQALRISKVERRFFWPLALWGYPTLRGEPGFKEILIDMGLVDYWRKSNKWSDFCREIPGKDDFECFEKPLVQAVP